ncbi:MAG TPA: hypothetical protein VF832_07910 [Longimicrobiales bacterium]
MAAEPRALRELADAPGLRHHRLTWDEFLDTRLAAPDSTGDALPSDDGDILVTPPFTPHLALAWLLRTLPPRAPGMSWSLEPFARQPATPFRHQAEGGPLLLSHADWVCPVNCIEPGRCPKIRAPRDWEMDRTVRELARDLGEAGQPVDTVQLFHCHHIAYGVGGYPLACLPAAARAILDHVRRARPGQEVRALVGTISHCHGALHLLSARGGDESPLANSPAGMDREAEFAILPPPDGTINPDDRDP